MKRRGFIRRISLSLASIAGAFLGISLLRQISFGTLNKDKRVKLGNISDFPVDTFTFVENVNIFIYRDHEAVKAVSAICTHLGCLIHSTTTGFECPCHGSCYSKDGQVLSGPAPTALSWYKLEKSADGHMVVDLNASADPGDKFYIT